MIRSHEVARYWLLCGAGPYGPERWGFRLESFDGAIKIDAVDEESGAGQDQLALIALVRGLEAIDEPADVLVLTPNRYLWQGLTEGLDEWRENSWCWEAFGELVPVKYIDLWQRVDRLRSIHRLTCRAIPMSQVGSVTSFVAAESPEARRAARQRPRRIQFTHSGELIPASPRRRAARELQSA
jgi:ribonuclease HI